jgi:cytochrome b involved in lipid metabolism
MTFYTLEEVNEHNTEESCWVVSNNNVYDVTTFISRHPGGKFAILSKAGENATTQFAWHSTRAKGLWKLYKIGKIKRCCF